MFLNESIFDNNFFFIIVNCYNNAFMASLCFKNNFVIMYSEQITEKR